MNKSDKKRYKISTPPGGKLTICGGVVVNGACDLDGVLTDGEIKVPKGKRLVIEDEIETRR